MLSELTGIQRWIFVESVRRTILMAYSAVALYKMMRRGSEARGEGGKMCSVFFFIEAMFCTRSRGWLLTFIIKKATMT